MEKQKMLNPKKHIVTAIGTLLAVLAFNVAHASFIEATNSCPNGTGCDPTVTDNYGFSLKIEDTANANVYKATLKNLSPAFPNSGADAKGALIDLFAFNMDADLGTDFTIANFNPNTWGISVSPNNIQFDYLGSRDTNQVDKLGPGAMLTFEFNFTNAFLATLMNPFDVWTGTSTSTGQGFGGGTDTGQVGVSFQNLANGAGSDLLAANWDLTVPPPPPPPVGGVPEPSSLALFGLSLLCLVGVVSRRIKIRP